MVYLNLRKEYSNMATFEISFTPGNWLTKAGRFDVWNGFLCHHVRSYELLKIVRFLAQLV